MAEADFYKTWRSWAVGVSGSPWDLKDTYYSELTEYLVHEHKRVRCKRNENDLKESHQVYGQWVDRVEV